VQPGAGLAGLLRHGSLSPAVTSW